MSLLCCFTETQKHRSTRYAFILTRTRKLVTSLWQPAAGLRHFSVPAGGVNARSSSGCRSPQWVPGTVWSKMAVKTNSACERRRYLHLQRKRVPSRWAPEGPHTQLCCQHSPWSERCMSSLCLQKCRNIAPDPEAERHRPLLGTRLHSSLHVTHRKQPRAEFYSTVFT